jgi:hypothetical protein
MNLPEHCCFAPLVKKVLQEYPRSVHDELGSWSTIARLGNQGAAHSRDARPSDRRTVD